MNIPLPETAILHSIVSLVAAGLVVMGSPGPAVISVAAVGAAYGPSRSLAYLGGIIAGTTLVLLAVAAGVMSLLMAHPRIAPALQALSCAYMVYLAVRIATAPPFAQAVSMRVPGFGGGLLLALANPKAWLALGAVFGGTTIAAVSHLAGSLIKVAVLSAMIVVIHLCWLLAGSAFARLLRRPGTARAVNLLFAALLLAGTAWPLIGTAACTNVQDGRPCER